MKGKNYWTVERPPRCLARDEEQHEHFEQVRADHWTLDGGTLIFYNGAELTIRSQVIGFAQGQWLTWFWDEDSVELHAFRPDADELLCTVCGAKKSDYRHVEDEETP